MGDHLIVALTLDEFVRKGPGRPLYPWKDRAAVLRALRCVDDVVKSPNAVYVIRNLKPNIFVKGVDYAGRDQWTEDIETVCKEVGCQLRFTTSAKQSVTDVIRRTMSIPFHDMWYKK